MSFISRLLQSKQKKKRRPPFKDLYDLNRRQPVNVFEQKMIKGMFSEGKEVFVTAFCRGDEVLRVTANIGSKYRCRPADDYTNWGWKAQEMGGTEIRQYHNHLGKGEAKFSKTDKRNYPIFREHVEPFGIKIRFFLVYPRRLIGGYTIREF
jgi:hypothetical protein